MKIRLIALAGLILWAAAVAAAYQDENLSFSRPTIEASTLKTAPKSAIKLYEDEEFVFLSRPAVGKESAPGLFVYGKKPGIWIEIKKVSTENAKLGRLSSGEEMRLIVGKKQYLELPLKSGATLNIPSKVKYDADIEVYMLEFDPWQKKDEHLTRLWIDREDLGEAFKSVK
jgi:hypothetical protein